MVCSRRAKDLAGMDGHVAAFMLPLHSWTVIDVVHSLAKKKGGMLGTTCCRCVCADMDSIGGIIR